MNKKIISVLLILAIAVSNVIFVHAEEEILVTTGENVSLYVNNEKVSGTVTVSETDELMFKDEDALVIKTAYGYYLPGEVFCASDDMDFTEAYAIYDTGLSMVNGAQVRVGNVELSEDGKLSGVEDSGLRFIATANYTDTLIAEENVTFGIKVRAEQGEGEAYIEAERFQNTEKTIFSAAITNLNTNNYNRKYTATAYALATLANGDMVEFNSGEVTRSVYQVSVGIMKNSSGEADDSLPYTIDDAVKNVLNAYINQTGIRLVYKSDGSMTESEVYTGDLFFDVECTINDDSTDVVITTFGEADGFANEVMIASWWKEYVRINNSNTAVQWYIRNSSIENGILKFTFKIPDYTFNQEDNVMIVASLDEEKITGYKAGVLTEYSLKDEVDVWGLSNEIGDVVPGCVVLIGETNDGKCGGIELLATLGLPIDPELFESNFGVYSPVDGSNKYKNVVTEMFSKSGSKLTCQSLPDTTKTIYIFESSGSMCYRVGIAMDGETPVITATGNKISTYPSIFESTAEYHNYLYLRYNAQTEKVKECVFYCVPKDLDFTGGGEYSDIFSLDDYRVIIE